MKRSLPCILSLGGCLMLSHRMDAEIQLVGLAREGAAVRVSLVDPENRTAAWVAIGETFNGSKVVAVSQKFDEVTLRRDGHEQRVHLREAVIERDQTESVAAREERFGREFHLMMMRDPANNNPNLTAEQLIQFAAKFGRVVLRREAKPEQDVIVVGLPGTNSDPRGKDRFLVTNMPKDGSRGYTVLIR